MNYTEDQLFMKDKLDKINWLMDKAVPEWTIDYQTISFQELGIKTPLRVYQDEENPTEGTRVDLASLHMILFGTPLKYFDMSREI